MRLVHRFWWYKWELCYTFLRNTIHRSAIRPCSLTSLGQGVDTAHPRSKSKLGKTQEGAIYLGGNMCGCQTYDRMNYHVVRREMKVETTKVTMYAHQIR